MDNLVKNQFLRYFFRHKMLYHVLSAGGGSGLARAVVIDVRDGKGVW